MKINLDKLEQLKTKVSRFSKKAAKKTETVEIAEKDDRAATDRIAETTKAAEAIKTLKSTNKRKNIVITIAVALCLIIFGISCTNGSNPSSSSTETKAAEKVEDATLSFTVDVDSWDASTDEDLIIQISGASVEGGLVSEQYKAVPDTKYQTDLKSGYYTIALASTKATQGSKIYKAEAVKFDFTGKSDKNVVLKVTFDKEATEAAETEKKAAEEKEAAEKKAAEDKAAAEKAAAEAAAAAAVVSSTTGQSTSSGSTASSGSSGGSSVSAGSGGSSSGGTVYIAASGKGKRYHSRSTCGTMKNSIAVPLAQAQSSGLTPCGNCM